MARLVSLALACALWVTGTELLAGEWDALRAASIVSRDSKFFLAVARRDSAVRRVRATDVGDVLARVVSPDTLELVPEFLGEGSLFSPDLLRAIPQILSTGRGEMALSLEGFSLIDGQLRPELLWIASVEGFEGVVAAIGALADRDVGTEDSLQSYSLPFSIQPGSVRRIPYVRESLVEFTTTAGHRLVVVEVDGLLIGSQSPDRIKRGLDRLWSSAFGSLLDGYRYRLALRQLSPRPGDLLWYANLRRLRTEEADVLTPKGFPRWLLDRLDDYDGCAGVVRGEGDRFTTRVFLEPRSRVGTHVTAGINAPFRAPSVLRPSIGGMVAFRPAPEAIVDWLDLLANNLGGSRTVDRAKELLSDVGGTRWISELRSELDGEFVLIDPRGVLRGEPMPRVVAMVAVKHPQRVVAWMERGARLAQEHEIRPIQIEGYPGLELRLARNGLIPLPACVLWDRWLMVAPNAFVLRETLADLITPAPALDVSDSFFAPFDQIDVDPNAASYALGYFDTRRLAQGAADWGIQLHTGAAIRGAGDDALMLVQDLVTLVDDPEFQDALHSIGFQVEVIDAGLMIVASGP